MSEINEKIQTDTDHGFQNSLFISTLHLIREYIDAQAADTNEQVLKLNNELVTYKKLYQSTINSGRFMLADLIVKTVKNPLRIFLWPMYIWKIVRKR